MAEELTLTFAEKLMVLRHRREASDRLAFNKGIDAAFLHLKSLADQCIGVAGTGESARTYRSAANSLLSLMKEVA